MTEQTRSRAAFRGFGDARGFTLIEVLIALVVISVGVLGLIALQTHTLGTTHQSDLMSWANVQAMDLEERMRANPGEANAYTAADLNAAPSSLANPDCASSVCTPAQRASHDIHQWVATTRALFPASLDATLIRQQGSDAFDLTMRWTASDQCNSPRASCSGGSSGSTSTWSSCGSKNDGGASQNPHCFHYRFLLMQAPS